MIDRFKWVFCCILIITWHFAASPNALGADIHAENTPDLKVRPSGVLVNAANAAASAANAASAAANAANAAAKAATAALDALNVILQQSPVAPQSETAKTPPGDPASPMQNIPLPVTDTPVAAPANDLMTKSPAVAGRFVAPEEHSLVGLVGKFEIPVFADIGGEFVKNIAGNQIVENESAGKIDETNIAESIRAGRGFSRESLAAGARTEQAKAQTGQALALLLPSVSIRASKGSEISEPSVALDPVTGKPISSDTHMRTDVALTIRQPLFDLPSYFDWRRRGVIEQARNESYRVSDGDAYISAVNAYLSLVSSRLQTDLTQYFEAQLKELLTYVEKRARAGAASVSDMARVRARSQ